MTIPAFIRKNALVILGLLVFGFLYFSIAGRTLLIKALMRTGLYKTEIKSDRKKMIESNTWVLPEGIVFADSAGRKVNLANQKGKLLFVNFWATWCPPCRAEMPSINALRNKLKGKNIDFYMVDVDQKTEESIKYMRKKQFDLPVHTIASFIPPEIFDGNLPTTLLISPEGKIVYHHIGAADYDDPEFLKLMNSYSEQ